MLLINTNNIGIGTNSNSRQQANRLLAEVRHRSGNVSYLYYTFVLNKGLQN